MFTIFVVLVNAAILVQCQICHLDDRLQVMDKIGDGVGTPWSSSLQGYFAFVCPPGFQQNSTHCIMPNSSATSCLLLETMNLEYNITECNMRQTHNHSLTYSTTCAYPFSQFLATHTEPNDVNLKLIMEKSLYLYVYGKNVFNNITEKLRCWGTMIQNNRSNSTIQSIKFQPTFTARTKNFLCYTLPIQTPYTTYFCMFLYPGKHKPVVSNKINMLEQQRSIYTILDLKNVCSCVHGGCNIGNFNFNKTLTCEIIDGVTVIFLRKNAFKSIAHAIDYVKNIAEDNADVDSSGGVDSSEELDEFIISNQYCLEEKDEINDVLWCTTSLGKKTVPCKNPCVDDEGNIITRTCEGGYLTGAKWSQPSAICSENRILPEASTFLLNNKHTFVTPDTLFNISSVIRNSPNITAIDLDSVSTVLSNAVNQNNSAVLQDAYFDAIDNVLNINETAFSRAFHARENILQSLDQFVETISSPANLSYQNLALRVYRPYSSLTNSFDQMLTVERVSAKFPMEMLQELLVSSPGQVNFTVAMTVFKNRKLFQEGIVASDIADLIIPNTNVTFTQPISIFIEQNSVYDDVICAYWDFGINTPGNWSTIGVETIRTNNNTIVECQTYHLTSFVLLGISERVIGEISNPIHKEILKYISTFGCLLSLIGTSITIYTAFACPKWYKRRINSLQLCYVVLLEVIMLFVADIFETTGASCIAVGAIMHYLVLVKFLITLMIAKQQYSNFVTVMQSRNTSHYKLIHTPVILIVPFIFVTIAASVFPDKYNSGSLNFCYPKDGVFMYFLILPISLILLVNAAIFCLVMIKISNSITRGAKEKNLQLKLAFMLWFMLGLTWFLGILAEISTTLWLQIIFVYGFCILGPLQGFVVFWFTVIRDKDAIVFWKNNLETITHARTDEKSATKDSTSMTLLSTTNTNTNEAK